MLTEKVELLNNQVNTLTEINNLYIKQDSIKSEELETYKESYEAALDNYVKLNKKYKAYKVVSFSSLLILLGALICL